MSTSVDQSFITQYNSDVHEVFQRKGSYLMPAVFHKSGIVGSTCSFHKIGTGVAVTKARHGTITPMNQEHTAPSCVLVDFYAGDWVDKLDEAKTNMDVRKAYANGGAMALGRKCDDQITTVLDTTSQAVIGITEGSTAAAFLGSVLTWVEALWTNDVPNDGQIYGVVSPRFWSQLMVLPQFQNSDFVGADGQAYTQGPMVGMGKWRDWMGVKWKMQTGMPGMGTSASKAFIWHQTAIGYASAAAAGNIAGNNSVAADITWHGDRAAHWVNHLMSGQAVMIDDTGVIEANIDDTASVIVT